MVRFRESARASRTGLARCLNQTVHVGQRGSAKTSCISSLAEQRPTNGARVAGSIPVCNSVLVRTQGTSWGGTQNRPEELRLPDALTVKIRMTDSENVRSSTTRVPNNQTSGALAP